jgi:ABC-type multidrug transport system ATPase subunit
MFPKYTNAAEMIPEPKPQLPVAGGVSSVPPASTSTNVQMSSVPVPITISIEHLSVRASTNNTNHTSPYLFRDISTTIHPGQLTVIIGASGVGKTSLLNAICQSSTSKESQHQQPPRSGSQMEMTTVSSPITDRSTTSAESVHHHSTGRRSGRVLVNGRLLSECSDDFKSNQIRYITHVIDNLLPGLTVFETLTYVAALELTAAAGWNDTSRAARVRSVIAELGLNDCAHLVITPTDDGSGNTDATASGGGLSGGQRRRTQIAVHLIADPAVLILDEPTSVRLHALPHQFPTP